MITKTISFEEKWYHSYKITWNFYSIILNIKNMNQINNSLKEFTKEELLKYYNKLEFIKFHLFETLNLKGVYFDDF